MAVLQVISKPQPPWIVAMLVVFLFAALGLFAVKDSTRTCRSDITAISEIPSFKALPPDLSAAIIHYATTNIVPQQTFAEIILTARVLANNGPCNFLVFGLGFDSVLWKSLNYGGRTVFLEETKEWMENVKGKHKDLEAYHVQYNTQLKDANGLMDYARSERKKACRPIQKIQESSCKIALNMLPEELYSVQWDVIMVDAPRGYFPEAPGRMGAIFSAGVMARSRSDNRTTHIFVHDVERPVERTFCQEFLCNKYLTEEAPTKRLWHFHIPPSSNPKSKNFC